MTLAELTRRNLGIFFDPLLDEMDNESRGEYYETDRGLFENNCMDDIIDFIADNKDKLPLGLGSRLLSHNQKAPKAPIPPSPPAPPSKL